MNVNAKFRGETADGKWVYGYLVKFIMEDGLEKHFIINENLRFHWDTFLYNILIEVRPETLGQWTGQKDKNGNDGFCGDLVKHKDGTIYQIVFNAELASFCLKFSVGKNSGFTSFDRLNKLSAYDIIGNIHDNPELLEGK